MKRKENRKIKKRNKRKRKTEKEKMTRIQQLVCYKVGISRLYYWNLGVRGRLIAVFIRVSIAMKRNYDHSNSYRKIFNGL